MKFTKNDIEKMADEIWEALKENECLNGCVLYYNGKRKFINRKYTRDYSSYEDFTITEYNEDPHKYFEYAAYEHIFSMSFDGSDVYDYYNEWGECKFLDKIFAKYKLYAELGHSWNLTCCPMDDDEYETTNYERPKETIYLYSHTVPEDIELYKIINTWKQLVEFYGVGGSSCVVGDGIYFEYKNNRYFLSTNYNQCESHYMVIEELERELKLIGATNIYYDCGRLD